MTPRPENGNAMVEGDGKRMVEPTPTKMHRLHPLGVGRVPRDGQVDEEDASTSRWEEDARLHRLDHPLCRAAEIAADRREATR